MDKDLLHKIFVSLRGIKQELYAKSFQVNNIREKPRLKTHVVNLKRDAKELSCDLQRLEVRGKLGSRTLSNVKLRICSCLAYVYRVMDARGKFREHERCVRVALGYRLVQLLRIFRAL